MADAAVRSVIWAVRTRKHQCRSNGCLVEGVPSYTLYIPPDDQPLPGCRQSKVGAGRGSAWRCCVPPDSAARGAELEGVLRRLSSSPLKTYSPYSFGFLVQTLSSPPASGLVSRQRSSKRTKVLSIART